MQSIKTDFIDSVRPEEDVSREKALQTVVAGQQAENLLDFDAEDQTPGLGNGDNRRESDMGMISTQQIATAAKASNPLDELMDLFSTANMHTPAVPAGAATGLAGGVNGSMSGGSGITAGLGRDLMSPPPLGVGPISPAASVPAGPPGGEKAEQDLLGLF